MVVNSFELNKECSVFKSYVGLIFGLVMVLRGCRTILAVKSENKEPIHIKIYRVGREFLEFFFLQNLF